MIKFFDVELIQYKFTYILDILACKLIIKVNGEYIDIIFDIAERNIKTEQNISFLLKPEFSDEINIIITKEYLSFEINDNEYYFKINNFTLEKSDFCESY